MGKKPVVNDSINVVEMASIYTGHVSQEAADWEWTGGYGEGFERRAFPGFVGSIDCTKLFLKNGSTQDKGK